MTRKELKHNFINGVMDLRNKGLVEQDSLLDLFEDVIEPCIAELEARIEKMKNWCNCKNYQQCLIELAEQGKGMKSSECCVNCKKWDIKENA